MRIHLVGGAVRDILLGRPLTDRDYLVADAAQSDFQGRYPTARLVGKSFPVFILDGAEYAWPRGGSLQADLTLRDLTVNAMALDDAGVLHAHPMALHDLQARVLRPCSPTSLQDDPVRVFRAARFAAQLPDFSAAPELLEQMRALGGARPLAEQAAERMGREISKALAAPRPSRCFELLEATGCLRPWLEELAACRGIPAGPPAFHDKDVFGHLCEVMDRLAGDALDVWMGLAHDLGKAATAPEILPAHHGHEEAGSAPARALALRLRLPTLFVEAGELAAREHMRARRYRELRPGTRVDMLLRLEARRLTTRLFRLVDADSAGKPGAPEPGELLRLARRDLRAIRKVILPEHLRDQGEKSGEALRQLRCEALKAADREDPPG